MRRMAWLPAVCVCLSAAGSPARVPAAEPNLATLEKEFRELPMEARRLTGPLFWLHGTESRERLETYIEKVAEGHNGTFTAESRPHNDWLGPGWWRDLDICLAAAKKHDLTMYLFDEKWWPSQMVGGKVPHQYGSKMLAATATTVEGPKALREEGYAGNLVAVIAGKQAAGGLDGASLVDLTDRVKDGLLSWDTPDGPWKVMKFTWEFAGAKGFQQTMVSVDGASRDCVGWFLKTVYQPHYDRYKDDFGRTIVGYFYDEPETQGDWGTEVLPILRERKVDWKKALVAWKFPLAGDEQAAAKYQYGDAFAEAWGRTMYGGMSEWCRAHGVVSMGHFMEHGFEYLSPRLCAGNMFQLLKYSDMGGIDLVCQQMYPGQRPRDIYQTPKLGSSVTHVYGKKDDITMCEMFGAYGQPITYPEMKWLTDQMQVRGVNFMIPHSFNPKAPNDTDCPPYFWMDDWEPRWPLYRVYADYTSRLSLWLSGGRHVCPIALLFLGQSAHVGRYVTPEDMTTALQDALYDCDWMPYDVLEGSAKIDGKEIKLYQESYRILIVPPVEVIPYAALAKAKEFFEAGGIVVGYGFLPTKSATLGKTSKDIAELVEAIWGQGAKPDTKAVKASAAGGKSYLLPEKPTPEALHKVLVDDAGVAPVLDVVEGKTDGWVHVLHRVKSGRDVFLVVNQNHKGEARKLKFRAAAKGVPELWDAMRNEISAIPYKQVAEGSVEFELTMEPNESALIIFSDGKTARQPRIGALGQAARPPIEVVRDAPVKEAEAAPSAPKPKGLTLDGCPWVWFKEGNPRAAAPVGTRYFRGLLHLPADRGIRQARMLITCDNDFVLYVNGKEAGRSDSADESWRRPREIDLTKHLTVGPNLLAVEATNGPGQQGAPNPAGLIGKYEIGFADGASQAGMIDETWKAADRKLDGWNSAAFDDKAWPGALKLAVYGDPPWGKPGVDAGAVTRSPIVADIFQGRCTVPADVDLAKCRAVLVMEGLPEESAAVTVNEKFAGGVIGAPARLDVTALVKRGENVIRIAPLAPKAAKVVMYP